MYGGRVSDDMDRRILKTYLEEYMGDFLFDDCEKFTFSRTGFEYTIPEWGEVRPPSHRIASYSAAHRRLLSTRTHLTTCPPPFPALFQLENYTSMVESLPLTNSPAVFGLHPNAEIGYYSSAVKSMWINLISLQPRRAAGGVGMSREDLIGTTARDIYSKIPLQSMDVGSYDLLQIRVILLKRNNTEIITPCQVVLLQELERWNNLVKKMAGSLADLQRALVGEIGMSDDLDALGDSLFNGFLPQMWKKLCPDTQKPLGSWVTHYTKRHEQYEGWIHTGEPIVMWLSGLHIPESYLTALVQTTCRMRGWPLDKSTLYTVVTKYVSADGLARLDSGCYVHGLYLEGAAWDLDRGELRAQDPKVLVVELPIMQVRNPLQTTTHRPCKSWILTNALFLLSFFFPSGDPDRGVQTQAAQHVPHAGVRHPGAAERHGRGAGLRGRPRHVVAQLALGAARRVLVPQHGRVKHTHARTHTPWNIEKRVGEGGGERL
jgi:dynein heavy chain